jgi:hypothetical protein
LIPTLWYHPVAAYLWGVVVHSAIAGLLFYGWSRRLATPPGRARRAMLVVALCLPLLTAAVPGRNDFDFRANTAWLDSARVLALPIAGPLRVWAVALGLGGLAALATLWQELLQPWVDARRRRRGEALPELETVARSLPGWESCRARRLADEHLVVATTGRPGRVELLVSDAIRERLSAEELTAVIRHEHAHWQRGRWWWSHALFAVRLLQLHNPFALWLFREWVIELEIRCDADAVRGDDPRPLARALLAVYSATDPADHAARATLRRRVDLLLGRRPETGHEPGWPVLATAVLLLALGLPWIV